MENDVILILRILSFFAVDLHWGSPRLVSQTVGYYRTAVGYYRVIAQKVLESKSIHQDLLKTPKNIKIGPITVENDKNEKRKNFCYRNIRFSSIFLETSDPTTKCRSDRWIILKTNPADHLTDHSAKNSPPFKRLFRR